MIERGLARGAGFRLRRPGALPGRIALALGLASALAAGPATASPATAGPAAAATSPPQTVPAGTEAVTATAVDLPPGSELRTVPAWEAPVVAVSAGGTATLEGVSLGDWIEVRQGEATGWVRVDEPADWPADGPAVLSRARRRLGAAAAVERALGPFAAISDLPDDGLWRTLGRLAGAAVELWSERYGLDPAGIAPGDPAVGAPETVVVFTREEDYRASSPPASADLAGHATAGFSLLWAGERSASEIGVTLVHELTHLLNRRAFGYAPPVWLDEGTAEDLALARSDGHGRLSAAPLNRRTIHTGSRIDLYGPLVALRALLGSLEAGKLPPLPEALALDRRALLASPLRNHFYAYYGFWIRYLMEGEGGDLRAGFRTFLAAAAAGGDPGPDALAAALGRDWAELEAGYHGWLRGLPRRLGLPGR